MSSTKTITNTRTAPQKRKAAGFNNKVKFILLLPNNSNAKVAPCKTETEKTSSSSNNTIKSCSRSSSSNNSNTISNDSHNLSQPLKKSNSSVLLEAEKQSQQSQQTETNNACTIIRPSSPRSVCLSEPKTTTTTTSVSSTTPAATEVIPITPEIIYDDNGDEIFVIDFDADIDTALGLDKKEDTDDTAKNDDNIIQFSSDLSSTTPTLTTPTKSENELTPPSHLDVAVESSSSSSSLSQFDESLPHVDHDHDHDTVVVVKVQALIRGTLARWNYRVLQLQHKLATIQRVKEKQLKKIASRKVNAQRNSRVEMEYTFKHRGQLRRIRQATIVRNHFTKLHNAEATKLQALHKEIVELKNQNNAIARQVMMTMEDSKRLRREILGLNYAKRELETRCKEYQKAVEIFQTTLPSSSAPEQQEHESLPMMMITSP